MVQDHLKIKLRIWRRTVIIQLWNIKHYTTSRQESQLAGTTRVASSKEEIGHRWMARCFEQMLGWVARNNASAAAWERWSLWVVWQMVEYATMETTDDEQELQWDNSPSIMCNSPMMWSWDLNHIIWTGSNKLPDPLGTTIINEQTINQMYTVLKNTTPIINADNMETAIRFVQSMERSLDRSIDHSPYTIVKDYYKWVLPDLSPEHIITF